MPSEDTKILDLINIKNLIKHHFLFIIYHLECIMEENDECKNNFVNSSTTKVSKHIPSGSPVFSVSLFRSIENKYDV